MSSASNTSSNLLSPQDYDDLNDAMRRNRSRSPRGTRSHLRSQSQGDKATDTSTSSDKAGASQGSESTDTKKE